MARSDEPLKAYRVVTSVTSNWAFKVKARGEYEALRLVNNSQEREKLDPPEFVGYEDDDHAYIQDVTELGPA